MPIRDAVELSDEERSLKQAYQRFATVGQPLLEKQFNADGFPEKLCHYTDFNGLQGILEKGALWATYTQTLNDGSEQEYGLKIVNGHIATMPGGNPSTKLSAAIDQQSQRAFTCCFCESSDLLSMWIAYGKRGGGYCMEFDGTNGLLSRRFPPFSTFLPFRMTYGTVVPEAVMEFLHYACQFARSGDVETSVASNWINIMAMKFKHPAFVHEAERRIVILNPPISAMKFRPGDSDIKPYIELMPLAEDGSRLLPLRRVIFGPTLRQDQTMIDVIGLMLERYGYSGVPVESCGIPYRL